MLYKQLILDKNRFKNHLTLFIVLGLLINFKKTDWKQPLLQNI